MVTVSKTHSSEFGLSGAILAGLFTAAVVFVLIVVPQLVLHGDMESDHVRPVSLFIAATGLIAFIIVSMSCRHFIMARLRYGATPAEASYWQANHHLRMNGRTPHSRAEFKALLQLAQEADRVLAPAYVAERTAKFFAELTDDRGLWRQKASSAWLGPIVLQGIIDANAQGADDGEPEADEE